MERKDFNFTYDKFGYMVQYKGHNIGGAGTSRDRKIHYKHAQANLIMYKEHAEIDIQNIIAGKEKRYSDVIRTLNLDD